LAERIEIPPLARKMKLWEYDSPRGSITPHIPPSECWEAEQPRGPTSQREVVVLAGKLETNPGRGSSPTHHNSKQLSAQGIFEVRDLIGVIVTMGLGRIPVVLAGIQKKPEIPDRSRQRHNS